MLSTPGDSRNRIQTIPGNNYKIVLKNAEDGLIRLMCDCKMYFLFPCYYSYCFPPIFIFFLKNRRLIMLENHLTKSLKCSFLTFSVDNCQNTAFNALFRTLEALTFESQSASVCYIYIYSPFTLRCGLLGRDSLERKHFCTGRRTVAIDT